LPFGQRSGLRWDIGTKSYFIAFPLGKIRVALS
jgi:hypothetical protein